MTKLAGIPQKLNILTTLPDLRNYVKWGYRTYYPRFSATLYRSNSVYKKLSVDLSIVDLSNVGANT